MLKEAIAEARMERHMEKSIMGGLVDNNDFLVTLKKRERPKKDKCFNLRLCY